ncbi:MAG: hypothetical protein ABF709_05120 [Leuconostoc pseudomesenteroides]|uniref:hypothetical protein n=1 Tax=Leuconostoc pseudomesenteroides TaxID=33968 RepID=UPI001E49A202|nr:hypothetical protein [Leuconostoc pseudomesenteroides]
MMWFLQVIVTVIIVGGAFVLGIEQGESQERERLEKERRFKAMGGSGNKYL